MKNDEFESLLAEVFSANEPQEALNLSGVLLARVDEALRQKINQHSGCSPECVKLATAATVQCELLQSCGNDAMAYRTALTSLLLLDMVSQSGCGVADMDLCCLTFVALNSFAALAGVMPQDDFTMEHVPVLFSLWASRLYYYYSNADKSQPCRLPHIMKAAHAVLAKMIEQGLVQWPHVKLGDLEAGPQSSAVLADIIGRSVALEIFS